MKLRKILPLLLVMLGSAVLHAQKNDVKVKKGKIVKNGQPIATIDGKSGWFKAIDVTVSSLNGKPLIRFEQQAIGFKTMLYKSIGFFRISFYDGKNTVVKALIDPSDPRLLEQGAASKLFSDTMGIKLLENDSTLSEEGIKKFYTKYNYDVSADSANKVEYLKAISNALEGNVSRRKDQPFFLKQTRRVKTSIGAEYDKFLTEYEINQAGVVLGTVSVHTALVGITNATEYTVVVNKAVFKPFEWKGEKRFYAEAAVLKTSSDSPFYEFESLYTGGKLKIENIKSNSPEYLAVKALIDGGYL